MYSIIHFLWSIIFLRGPYSSGLGLCIESWNLVDLLRLHRTKHASAPAFTQAVNISPPNIITEKAMCGEKKT